jgi:hypothetical protein
LTSADLPSDHYVYKVAMPFQHERTWPDVKGRDRASQADQAARLLAVEVISQSIHPLQIERLGTAYGVSALHQGSQSH